MAVIGWGAASDQECANYLSWAKPEAGKDQAFNCDKFLHLTFVPEPLKLKQSNMNETNSFMGASSPETFMPILWAEAEVPAIVDSVENIASTWEYDRAGLWVDNYDRDNNNTNINICPHYVSSRELQPVNRTESKHWACIISIISSGTIVTWPGPLTGHQEPGAGCRGQGTTWAPGPGPPVGGVCS